MFKRKEKEKETLPNGASLICKILKEFCDFLWVLLKTPTSYLWVRSLGLFGESIVLAVSSSSPSTSLIFSLPPQPQTSSTQSTELHEIRRVFYIFPQQPTHPSEVSLNHRHGVPRRGALGRGHLRHRPPAVPTGPVSSKKEEQEKKNFTMAFSVSASLVSLVFWLPQDRQNKKKAYAKERPDPTD